MLNNDSISELKPFNPERSFNQLSPQAAQRVKTIEDATRYISALADIYTEENIREKTLDINPIIQSIERQAVDVDSLRQSVYGAYEAA